MADWIRAALMRFFAIATVAFAGIFFVAAAPSLAATTDNVTGWAWSGSIGWISMNCTNTPGECASSDYGVTMVSTPGFTDRADLEGWAWSENVGWICFGKTCSGTTPEGVAPYAQYRGTYGSQSDQFWGWAQVLSMGDDGWIALNCGNTADACVTSDYFLSLNDAGDFSLGGFNDHWAWGSNGDGTGVGWIDFSSVFPNVQTSWVESDLGTMTCQQAAYVTNASGGLYLSNFVMSFSNFWAGAGDLLECELSLPDGSTREVDSIIPTRTRNADISLTYASQPGGPDLHVTTTSIWSIDACRIADSIIGATCATEADCAPAGICDMNIHKCRQVLQSSTVVRPIYNYNASDACVPVAQYGRCVASPTTVCLYDSDNASHGCGGATPDQMCCPSAGGAPQSCQLGWGTCADTGTVCFNDTQCSAVQGVCQDGHQPCGTDADCVGHGAGVPTCSGINTCTDLVDPWIQTVYGNVFTKKNISVPYVPPQNQYNATYCVTAVGTIMNFNTQGSGGCAAMADATSRLALPQSANSYATVQGRLDLNGLRAGDYGPVTTVDAAQLDAILNAPNGLGGAVIRVVGDATVDATTVIANGNAAAGSGTVFIDGGNLTIKGDITYAPTPVSDLKQLASLGWIVIDDSSGTKGNVYVDGLVKTVSGAFYSDGTGGFSTVVPPATDSTTPLTVYGLVIAREFNLDRIYKSATQGSEQFIYDGRAVVNPPPGFADLAKALPVITDSAGP